MKTSVAISLANSIAYVQSQPTNRPVLFGFACAINAGRLEAVTKAFEAGRQRLLDDHAKTDVEGKRLEVEGRVELADEQAFAAAFAALAESEVAVDLQKVPLAMIGETIEPGILVGLLPMIEDSAQTKEAA